jgi:hypothetical protein
MCVYVYGDTCKTNHANILIVALALIWLPGDSFFKESSSPFSTTCDIPKRRPLYVSNAQLRMRACSLTKQITRFILSPPFLFSFSLAPRPKEKKKRVNVDASESTKRSSSLSSSTVDKAEQGSSAPSQTQTHSAPIAGVPRADSDFGKSWLRTTCMAALATLIDLFARFHDHLGPLLPDLLELFNSCVDQPDEELAKIGVQCWQLLLRAVGSKFREGDWTQLLQSLSRVLHRTLPHELCTPSVRAALKLPPASGAKQMSFAELFVIDGKVQEQSELDKVATVRLAEKAAPGVNAQTVATKGKVHLLLVDAALDLVLRFYEQHSEDGDVPSESASVLPPLPTSIALPPAASQAPPSEDMDGNRDIAISREIVDRVRRASIAEGQTRAFHGPTAQSKVEGVQGAKDSENEGVTVAHMMVLLSALGHSADFSRKFNTDGPLRIGLEKAGWMLGRAGNPPELWFQEAHSLSVCLRVLFNMYAKDTKVEGCLVDLCRCVLNDYKGRAGQGEQAKESLRCMDGVICALLNGLKDLTRERFLRLFPDFFPAVNDMIEFGSPSIRAVVRKLFETRFKAIFFGSEA